MRVELKAAVKAVPLASHLAVKMGNYLVAYLETTMVVTMAEV